MAKSAIPLSELTVLTPSTGLPAQKEDYSKGRAILMDKPLEWSSFDVVRYVRNRIRTKKVGHAGTLDPLATGLLVLCSGKATKSISQIQDQYKEYVTTVKFGESTPSYDAALPPDETAGWEHIKPKDIERVLKESFLGTIMQVPPIYSAIRKQGERLYKKARRGETVDIPPRQITIHEIEILDISMPYCSLRIKCGKGTYIRSIGHDLGIELGSLAHITELRRTKIGSFSVDDAFTPEQFNEQIEAIKNG